MESLIFIIVYALAAWWAYNLAENRGRNPVGWAIGAAFFPLPAICLLALLGNTNEKVVEAREEESKAEADKREAMKQELLDELQHNQ